MARKPTDKQLFKMKNEWLGQFYEEVKPKDFYRAVFPEGSFEREGHPEDEKCNGVLTVIEGEKARNYIVFDELNMVDEVKGAEFAIGVGFLIFLGASKVFEFYTEDYADTMSLAVFLISLAVSVYFAEPIRAVIPINLLLLLILVHIVYVLIRWYVKGCKRSRGYY